MQNELQHREARLVQQVPQSRVPFRGGRNVLRLGSFAPISLWYDAVRAHCTLIYHWGIWETLRQNFWGLSSQFLCKFEITTRSS